MRDWPFTPAVVFLMLLLVSAGSSQISGDESKEGLRWVFRELKRQRNQTGGNHERLHVSRLKRTVQKQCPSEQVTSPSGCRTGDPGCSCMCKTGSYLLYKECLLCRTCENDQVVEKNCTANSNTKCGCKPGQYKDCNIKRGPCDDFTCLNCTPCMAENKTMERNCSETQDAKCGDCLPGYNLSTNNACLLLQPPTSNPDIKPCNPGMQFCNPVAPGFRVEYVSLCIICPLLVGVLVMYCKRRWTKKPPTAGSLLSLPQPGLPMLRPTRCHSAPLQGRQLYTIIDVVPVRRWKEFVRSLGLRDSEIEAVELEHRQLREQQYEMLKCWWQKQGATMEAIFAALEEMELGGCAQELRQLLQPNNSPPSP